MSDSPGHTTLKWRLAQWLEIRWWKRYLNGRDPEEYLLWKTEYWHNFLKKITTLPHLTGQTILDAGCGPAGIFLSLSDNTVVAKDPLMEQYAKLPHFQPQRSKYVSFKTEAIEALTETNYYDTIFCLNAINHVADIQLCFEKLIAAAKPDGTIVVSIDAHRHDWLMPLFRLLPGDALHPHQYNLQGYEQLMEKAGCKITERILIQPGNIFDYWVLVGKKNK